MKIIIIVATTSRFAVSIITDLNNIAEKKINCNITQCLKITEKSHSTLRAKRATFTFKVDKSSLKMPKMVHYDEFLKTRSLLSNRVTRQVTFWWKMPKFENSNETFWVIFKHCGWLQNLKQQFWAVQIFTSRRVAPWTSPASSLTAPNLPLTYFGDMTML